MISTLFGTKPSDFSYWANASASSGFASLGKGDNLVGIDPPTTVGLENAMTREILFLKIAYSASIGPWPQLAMRDDRG
jgi:hypothetical protein